MSAVIHHDAAVPEAVGHEHLVRLGVVEDARRALEHLGLVAAGLATLADGHHELAVLRELEHLVVVRKIGRIVRVPSAFPTIQTKPLASTVMPCSFDGH